MAKKNEFKPDKPYSGFWAKLLLTPTQRRGVLKWSLYALTLVALSVIQDVMLCRLRIFGATTELIPCAIFMICLLEGMDRGSVFSLIASVLYVFSGSAAGIYCIVFITVLAVMVTFLRQRWLQSGFGTALLCTGVSMLVYEMAVFLIGLFLGLTTFSRIGSFFMTAVLTTVVVPVLYPVFKAIGGGDIWKE